MAVIRYCSTTLFLATFLFSAIVEQVACGVTSSNPRYELFPGVGYYKFHPDRKSWGSAWKVCNDEGSHLVIINSQAEADVLKGLIEERSNDTWMSVGFHDYFLNGQYATIFGQPIAATGYNVWSKGEPNNAYGGESCGSVGRDVKLNDIDCRLAHVFVCERELNKEEYLKNFNTWHEREFDVDVDVRSGASDQ